MGSLVDGLKNGGDYSVFSGCFTASNSWRRGDGAGCRQPETAFSRFRLPFSISTLHLPLPMPCKRPAHQRAAAMRHMGDVVAK